MYTIKSILLIITPFILTDMQHILHQEVLPKVCCGQSDRISSRNATGDVREWTMPPECRISTHYTVPARLLYMQEIQKLACAAGGDEQH